LFSDKGYDATSVREICEAAGITKPTLYHFYGSKEGVYRAIVEGALVRFQADLIRALDGEGSLRDRLVRMAQSYVEGTRREPELARFVMALIHNSPRSAPATDLVGFYQGILDALEEAYPVLQGTIRDHGTAKRRPFLRFFACEEDVSHDPPDRPLPEAVARGTEPFLVIGAIAGG